LFIVETAGVLQETA